MSIRPSILWSFALFFSIGMILVLTGKSSSAHAESSPEKTKAALKGSSKSESGQSYDHTEAPVLERNVANTEEEVSGDFRSAVKEEKTEMAPEKSAGAEVLEPEGVIAPGEHEKTTVSLVPPEVHHPEPKMSPEAKKSKYSLTSFASDPIYSNQPFNSDLETEIYTGKRAVKNSRPLLEIGRELYNSGPFQPGSDVFGKKNLMFAQLMMYGDWRTAVAYNNDGKNAFSRVATKLNLDVDLKITSTERIHAFFTPLDQDARFTRNDFSDDLRFTQLVLDPDPDALFFEGDLGRIAEGVTGEYNHLDLPFAGGIIPLIFQNGVWVEDAFTGAAFTIPARNSPFLDISNMDVTFFAGFDRVTTRAIPQDNKAHVFGMNAFIEATEGYWEGGYGFTKGQDEFSDFDYHNMTVSFTRRYFDKISNSLRVVTAFGQDLDNKKKTANGVLFLMENSLVTSLPSTLVPYCNMFVGIDRPQSLMRADGAGGILKNTGINFETDALTGYPKLDDTGSDTYGGALGIQYLFNLDQQLVFELAGLGVIGDDKDPDRAAKGTQFGPGIRYQVPIANDWILRMDSMVGFRNHEEDLFGARFEVRHKF